MNLLRKRAVCEITSLSYSTIYRLEKEGNFPQRVRLGRNSVGWIESEINAWTETRERGGADLKGATLQQHRPDYRRT